MKIYLATNNKNKQKEMAELLPEHEIAVPSSEGIDFAPNETGSTFYENSIIKAKALYDIVHEPVIADDSGICVDALDGRPGIYSSRYAGPEYPFGLPDGRKISQDEQNLFLIEELNDALKSPRPEHNGFLNGPRSCHYTCAFVLYLGGDRLYIVQETFEGTLIDNISKQAGTGGFGYDPIVFLPERGKTVAEISAAEKNAISHRGKAVAALKKIIDSL